MDLREMGGAGVKESSRGRLMREKKTNGGGRPKGKNS